MNIYEKISPVLDEHREFKDITETMAKGFSPLSVSGVSYIHKAQLAVMISRKVCRGTLLVITEDEACAKRLCDDINETAGDIACLFPAKDLTLTNVDRASKEYEYQRLCALTRVLDGSCKIICAGAEAVMQRTLPPEELKKRTVKITTADSVDFKELSERLVKAGYVKRDTVESPSQFSVRGSIADIFPVQEKSPVRMELWDDEID
ncbi:MAG: transcription-repair coupling factor, partial [Ruminococcus sp.]|nr:transcription-repair coupling factor [Ruminococcus sp.]